MLLYDIVIPPVGFIPIYVPLRPVSHPHKATPRYVGGLHPAHLSEVVLSHFLVLLFASHLHVVSSQRVECHHLVLLMIRIADVSICMQQQMRKGIVSFTELKWNYHNLFWCQIIFVYMSSMKINLLERCFLNKVRKLTSLCQSVM